MDKINLVQKFKLFSEFWSPRIVGELNGQYIKLAKFKGEFIWHSHANEDELFLVVKGTLNIEFRDKTVTLNEGEIYIVPKGVEHKPIAHEETHVLLLEPKSTEQTGGIPSDLLVDKQSWI
ncbi:cupin domain-containing protein [Legionella sp. 227]|uniref:cupin domain-containing protein n=1 Tax=Legionella sp. 227 TaxID=3367288 RepID=UPI00370D2B5E